MTRDPQIFFKILSFPHTILNNSYPIKPHTPSFRRS